MKRKVKIVINRTDIWPTGWSEVDGPIIDDIYVTPSVVAVKKGASVTFINKDTTTHVIHTYEGPAEYLFKSMEMKPGAKWKHKFEATGIYYYRSLTKPFVGGIIRVG